jgi:hypothetical protein
VKKLIASVTDWYAEPQVPGRHVGWVTNPYAYAQPTRQIALRKLKSTGKWIYQVLVFNLTNDMVFDLAAQPRRQTPPAEALLLAALAAYDQRGGGAETQNKGDKQGLHLAHRNKRGFAAQEILALLAQLAHNLLVWTRNDLAAYDDRFAHYGIARRVRDVLQIPGSVQLDAAERIVDIVLQANHPLSASVQATLVAQRAGDEM